VLRSLLPLYQAITSVTIDSGDSTSFWFDVWHGDEALADRFPILFSHCRNREATVKQAVSSLLQNAFVNRLSPQAISELQYVRQIIEATNLGDGDDKRLSPFCLGNGKFDTAGIYKLLKSRTGDRDPSSNFIWKSAAPPKAKFFLWLLVHGRIQCRANLLRKHIVDSATCEICEDADESSEHIIQGCPFAVSFWEAIGVSIPSQRPIRELHTTERPDHIPQEQFGMFINLCCWQLWKRRNGIIFQQETLTKRQVLLACKQEAEVWRFRLPPGKRQLIDQWCHVFDSAM
jgi:hypothetical protein